MFGVLFFTLSLTLVCASDRRLVNQINNLKEDLSYVNSEISLLFQHFDMLNKTIWSNVQGMLNHEMLTKMKGLESEIKVNQRLLERFEAAEKQNRAMQDELLELAKNVSKMAGSCKCMSNEASNDVRLQTPTLIQDRETTTPIPVPRSCKDKQTSGVFDIFFEFSVKCPTSVFCDADTDGGGWIVIMRRKDGSVNFSRNWTEYKNGFGNNNGEFWIGNDFLHEGTKSKPMELRVDMEDEDGNKVYAKYAEFKVGSEADKYLLTVSGYSGTAADGLKYHNGLKFSTFDQNNDPYKSCARVYGGGWWYNNCLKVLPTGTHNTGGMIMVWHNGRSLRVLKFAEMKIR